LTEHVDRAEGFFFVQLLEREAGVGKDIVAWFYFGGAFDTDAAVDSGEADVGFQEAVVLTDGEDFSRDG
jgi:hypothetical protein